MSTTGRVLTFGIVAGPIWSLAIYLSFAGTRSAGAIVMALVLGILTGVIVSFALKVPLIKFGRFGAFVASLLSLPLGAFVFGFFGELSDMLIAASKGRVIEYTAPFVSGLWYLVGSVASILSLLFFPAAVLTTFLLRYVIHSDKNHEDNA